MTRCTEMVRSFLDRVTREHDRRRPARKAPVRSDDHPQVRRVEVAGRPPVIGSIPVQGTGRATIELACVTRFSTADGVLYQFTATDQNGRRLPSVSRGDLGAQKTLLIPILRRSGDEPRVTVWVPDLPWWSIRLHYRIAIAGARSHDVIRAELRLRVSRVGTEDPTRAVGSR